jgi:uncharacterized phage protein (TIGR01671 family)
MHRIIKFRIWDKNIPRDLEEAEKEQSSGCMVDWEYVKKSCYLVDGLDGKYPIMQFTGLKDKNGKEIYEGDIIRIKWSNTASELLAGSEWIGKVFFNVGSFCIDGEWVESLNNINGAIEVIGNIYEK